MRRFVEQSSALIAEMLPFFSFLLLSTATSVPAAFIEKPSEKRALPSSFSWSASAALVGAKTDSYDIAGIKDPSIVEIDGTYHVFASTAKASGYNLVYFNFTDFAKAGSAPFSYLDATPIGTGYRAAPQVFYFEPGGLWYLVYQNGNAAYSTNTDINNAAGWTAPKTFYSSEPSLITDTAEYWVDMWVICDSSECFLFSSGDNGDLYRSQTSLEDFPAGMSDPVVALDDEKYNLFEASNVYTLPDGTYLLLVEAFGSDGYRYFRSWTSSSLTGTWTALADTETNPFASHDNVAFQDGTAWTESISHGEMVRSTTDQTMTIEDSGSWRYLFQGVDPASTADYDAQPWKLGLLTQVS